MLPHGRDFTTLVSQAPGANQEDKLGGLSIDGASAGENRFIVDGIETTDVQDGTQGKRLIADFVEEVQVKSSGYTAEFGGATGGVINVITKSGSNAWRGSALFNWEGDALRGDNRPTLRINLTNALAAEYITYPKDTANRIEPGFSLVVRSLPIVHGSSEPISRRSRPTSGPSMRRPPRTRASPAPSTRIRS